MVHKKTKKGVATVIAVLLVLAILFVLSSFAFYFIQETQIKTQGATESGQAEFLTKLSNCAKIISFDYNIQDKSASLVVKNCGFGNLKLANSAFLFIKTSNETCGFILDESSCLNCSLEIGQGAFAYLEINANANLCNGKTLADILTPQLGKICVARLTFSNAISETTFIPQNIQVCGREVYWETVNNSGCVNVFVTNTGKYNDTFEENITSFAYGGSASVTCYQNTSCIVERDCTKNIILNSGETTNYSLSISGSGSGLYGAKIKHVSQRCPEYVKWCQIVCENSNCPVDRNYTCSQ
ncbi:MAG: hypothetical protein QXQ79_00865 [Candidatus Nanoarchaeia archaeon]